MNLSQMGEMFPDVAAKVQGMAEGVASGEIADPDAHAASLVAPHAVLLASLPPFLKVVARALLRAILAALGE